MSTLVMSKEQSAAAIERLRGLSVLHPTGDGNTCEHCTTARVRTHGHYDHWCDGCVARAIARSLAAWHAMHERGSGDKEPLRELIARNFAQDRQPAAREAVWNWWKHDHEVTAAA